MVRLRAFGHHELMLVDCKCATMLGALHRRPVVDAQPHSI